MNCVNQTQSFKTVSSAYQHIHTDNVLQAIQQLGYKLDAYVPLKVRKQERQGFQKHRLIFTSNDLQSTHKDGNLQLLVTNSHDGSSSLEFRLGFFRTVCSNGLVVGSDFFAPIRIRHVGGFIEEKIEEAIEKVAANAAIANQCIEKMKGKTLTPDEYRAFCTQAVQLRDEKALPIKLGARRIADQATDLFTVFNVVQENLIRGGAIVLLEGEKKRFRKLTSIQATTEINDGLWNLAMKFAA